MSEKSNKINISEQEVIIAEFLLKLTAIENILITKNIISLDEVTAEMKRIASKIGELIKNKDTARPTPIEKVNVNKN